MFKLRPVCKAGDSHRREAKYATCGELRLASEGRAIAEDPAPRIQIRKMILDIIESRRRRECDSGIGASIERQILSDELSRVE